MSFAVQIQKVTPGISRLKIENKNACEGRTRREKTVYLCSGEGFGSGKHPTTVSCMECLDKILDRISPERILDAGTGNGVLALFAVCLGAKNVVAADILPEAVDTAKRNIHLNGLDDYICACCEDIVSLYGKFDLIVANLNPGSHGRLCPILEKRLLKKGYLILSGLAGFEREKVRKKMKEKSGLFLCEEMWNSGWTTFIFQKT
jgi:ribosomal protein L11 methyltransferase